MSMTTSNKLTLQSINFVSIFQPKDTSRKILADAQGEPHLVKAIFLI